MKKFIKPKTVLIIGIYSKQPTTGISKNSEILIEGLKERKVSFSWVKIHARSNGAIGSFQLTHSVKVMASVLSC